MFRNKGFSGGLVALMILVLLSLSSGIVMGTTNNLDSDVTITQTDGSLAGSQLTASSSAVSGITAEIQTSTASTNPTVFGVSIDNTIDQVGPTPKEEAQITNRAIVKNNGCRPTTEVTMDFDNLVKQTNSGTGVAANAIEENGMAVAGNIKKAKLSGDNEHQGAIYGQGSVQTTTLFNRADVNIRSGWCLDTSTADINLHNRIYDDPSKEVARETNIVSGDVWAGTELYNAKAGTLSANLGNDIIAGASDQNNASLVNIGYLGGTWKNDLDMTNTAKLFGTGPTTKLVLSEANVGHTKGFSNTQDLMNKGTLLRPALGTATSQTSNDYTSSGHINIINPGTVVSIS